MKRRYIIIKYLMVLLISLLTNATLVAQDLGASAYSKLTWDHISSTIDEASSAASIGLTTDNKMYVWGTNLACTIHTLKSTSNYPIWQTSPYYVPSPSGEKIVKVKVHANHSLSGFYPPCYVALSESGKLYAWGYNTGIFTNTWRNMGINYSTRSDTAQTIRKPTLLTNIGESSFVDFDIPISRANYWIAIGASGKAYHIGDGGSTTVYNTLPNPVGVDAGFKYTRVWVSPYYAVPYIYLKGNNGKIYYTGRMPATSTGVPSINNYNTPSPTVTPNEQAGSILLINPREVPFPAGEDIVEMKVSYESTGSSNYAISASGKAYIAGLWRTLMGRAGIPAYSDNRTYVVAPLKAQPSSANLAALYVNNTNADSLYILKTFQEVALPPGATKIIDIISSAGGTTTNNNIGTSVVGDNNKVYWSGTGGLGFSTSIIASGNYVTPANAQRYQVDECNNIESIHTNTFFSWSVESVNYEGAAKMYKPSRQNGIEQICIISKTGRGYFVGHAYGNTGAGKVENGEYSHYPVPISNELIASCNPSPGTGGSWSAGPVAPTNTAVGALDCGKTQLTPAPTAGTPSQLDLVVTINVSTAGTFTPITVSGSGMTVANGVNSVTTSTTGIQTFHIPMLYNGTALGTLNFTIGSAGSCTADLTKSPKKAIVDMWTLDCVPTQGPTLK